MTEKRCRRCQGVYASDAFRSMPKMRDGLDSWCRECHRVAALESYRRKRREPAALLGSERRAVAAVLRGCMAQGARRYPGRGPRAYMKTPAAWIADALTKEARLWRACPKCGRQFRSRRQDAQRMCGSLKCSYNISAPGDVACLYCATVFTGTPGRRFCSEDCSRRYHSSNHRHLRRAARRGNPLSDLAVFERDGWRCGICGRKVRADLPRRHPQGASLDHIVPLSAGGDHAPSNVQLAHLSCNVHKAASGAGQLRTGL